MSNALNSVSTQIIPQLNAQRAAELLGIEWFPEGWDFAAIHRAGQFVGFVCTKHDEIHCFRLDAFKGAWMTRQKIAQHIQPLIDRHGSAITTVRPDNDQGHAFVQRLGFVRCGERNGQTLYDIKRLKHARL